MQCITESNKKRPSTHRVGGLSDCQRASFLQIDSRVHAVDIALIEFPPQKFDSLAEALEMDDLPLPEELDHIIHIRVVREPQDVVVGYPSLLLWHAKITGTIIYRYIGNKRLIATIYDKLNRYILIKKSYGQAFFKSDYRKRLTQQTHRKRLTQRPFLVWSNLRSLIDAVMLKEAGGRTDLFPFNPLGKTNGAPMNSEPRQYYSKALGASVYPDEVISY